ncbi:hypothetical protein BU15DRAFT_77123 [Melanogaster broomeanus]|nr:hypothetical protein BU15DRAFT_77123 [Melanogaster broomeanus]
MLTTFPAPVLSVTADAVRDLQGHDALSSLWTIFTKCAESLQDGRRLENISWRLWYRELVQARDSYQPLTPESMAPHPHPHPNDSRYYTPFFSADDDAKKVAVPQALPLGLPSPADQPSPSPSPSPTMAPPPTPERPRITPSPTCSTAPMSASFTRGKPASFVGRIIVDMLPQNALLPERRSPRPTATVPPVPSVQLLSTPPPTEPSFPRVVVVNPTPRPTPPTTPVLNDILPGGRQPPSTFLLPLPPPALKPAIVRPSLQQQQQPQPVPTEPLPSPAPFGDADAASLVRQSDRRFFLPHPPDDVSPEAGDASTASGKSPSDLFEPCSATSSQMKSIMTDVDAEEGEKDEDEDDRRSMTAVTGTGAGMGHRAAYGRHAKQKKGKEVGKPRPAMRRSHSTRHVAPSMGRKSSAQPHPPAPAQERGEKKAALFNIGSGSSNTSRSANASTVGGLAPSRVDGATTSEPLGGAPSLQPHPPIVPNEVGNGPAVNVYVAPNANAAKTNGNVHGSPKANANAPSRRTRIVASTSSEDYETTDAEDSEGWASEEMDAEDKAKEVEDTKLREAAVEAQRQRDLFAKVPKRSYSNLNRTQSGLLSQLMNPSPAIFPPNHPYRISRSSHDIAHQYQQHQYHQLQHTPVPPQRSSSAFAPARLSTSKSAAALPMAAQITAISSSRPSASSGMQRQDNVKGGGYRPKGPPKEQEMEDESEEEHDADDKIQVSQSVAQQRLQALMSRRSSEQNTASYLVQSSAVATGPGLLASTATTAPIPVGHPYNLPAATPPMTPRTTRRRMLKTELSESMRRQLLWERQVSSNTNAALVARRASQLPLGGMRPLTSASTSNMEENRGTSSAKNAEAEDKDERRRRAMARNRSWADDYHYSGW